MLVVPPLLVYLSDLLLDLHLEGFSNADWACNVDDRRSTTNYCVFLGGNLVTRSSRKEQVVVRSRTESKYWVLANVTMELIWIKSLQDEL